MAWYLAPSLAQLRTEINTRWPGRDRASDGTIGDRRHQLSRSDHNENERGSVNAADFDEDGIDFDEVFAAIKRHPSARYVIYERKLYHRDRGWVAEDYDGDSPHDKHFHLSIDQTRKAEQDRRSWGLLTTAGGIMLPTHGDSGPDVGYWQRMLIAAGEKLPRYGVDEGYGDEMAAAARSWYFKQPGSDGDDYDGRAITSWVALQLQRQVFGGTGPTAAQLAAAVADHLKKNPPALPASIQFSGGTLTGVKVK